MPNGLIDKTLLNFKHNNKALDLDFASQRRNEEIQRIEEYQRIRALEEAQKANYDKDAWVSTEDVDTPYGVPVNATAAMLERYNMLGAQVATIAARFTDAMDIAGISDQDKEDYVLYKQFEESGRILPTQEQQAAIDRLQNSKYNDNSAVTGLPVPQEEVLRNLAGLFRPEVNAIEKIENTLAERKQTQEDYEKLLSPTKGITQQVQRDKLIGELTTLNTGASEKLYNGVDKVFDGDFSEGLSELYDGAAQFASSLGALKDNKASVTTFIAEVIPYMLAGTTGNAFLAAGYGMDTATEGMTRFIEEEGRLPTKAEIAELSAWSAAGAGTQYLVNNKLIEYFKGAKAAASAKPSVNPNALSTMDKAKGVAAGLGKSAWNVTKAGASEFAEETFQTLVENKLSSLDYEIDANDMGEALTGGWIGLAAGGGVAAIGEVRNVANQMGKAYEVAKETVDVDRKAIKEAANTGDFSNLDNKPTSKVEAVLKRNAAIEDEKESLNNFQTLVNTLVDNNEKADEIYDQYQQAAAKDPNSREAKNLFKAYNKLAETIIKQDGKIEAERNRLLKKYKTSDRKTTIRDALNGDLDAMLDIIGSMKLAPNSFTAKEYEALAKSPAATPLQKAQFEAQAHLAHNADSQEVNELIIRGGRRSGDNKRFVGFEEWLNSVNSAVSRGDLEKAAQYANQFNKFLARHQQKYDEGVIAAEKGSQSPEWAKFKAKYNAFPHKMGILKLINEEVNFGKALAPKIDAIILAAQPQQQSTQQQSTQTQQPETKGNPKQKYEDLKAKVEAGQATVEELEAALGELLINPEFQLSDEQDWLDEQETYIQSKRKTDDAPPPQDEPEMSFDDDYDYEGEFSDMMDWLNSDNASFEEQTKRSIKRSRKPRRTIPKEDTTSEITKFSNLLKTYTKVADTLRQLPNVADYVLQDLELVESLSNKFANAGEGNPIEIGFTEMNELFAVGRMITYGADSENEGDYNQALLASGVTEQELKANAEIYNEMLPNLNQTLSMVEEENGFEIRRANRKRRTVKPTWDSLTNPVGTQEYFQEAVDSGLLEFDNQDVMYDKGVEWESDLLPPAAFKGMKKGDTFPLTYKGTTYKAEYGTKEDSNTHWLLLYAMDSNEEGSSVKDNTALINAVNAVAKNDRDKGSKEKLWDYLRSYFVKDENSGIAKLFDLVRAATPKDFRVKVYNPNSTERVFVPNSVKDMFANGSPAVRNGNTIYFLDPEWLQQGYDPEILVFHELEHLSSADNIHDGYADNSIEYQELSRIWNILKGIDKSNLSQNVQGNLSYLLGEFSNEPVLDENGVPLPYWIAEMVTIATTEPEVQEFLKTVEAVNKEHKSLLENIYAIVIRILGGVATPDVISAFEAITSINANMKLADKTEPQGEQTTQFTGEVAVVKEYSNKLLKTYPNAVFIFGDNLTGRGKGGQAVIRDEPNAMGIPTKKSPATYDNAYFTDDDFDTAKAAIDKAIQAIVATGKNVFFPRGGLGTGLAKLDKRAPKVWAYLNEQLESVFDVVNTPKGLYKKSEQQSQQSDRPQFDANDTSVARGEYEFNKLPTPTDTPTMTYAGIGSRGKRIGYTGYNYVLDANIEAVMVEVAEALAKEGFTLNTGDATGSDAAFIKGANKAKGRFNKFTARHANNLTRVIAKFLHPKPDSLKPYPLDLMARNTNQVFGAKLDTPVDFVVVYTKGGETESADRSIKSGGSGQAIDMASRKGIPVINVMGKDGKLKTAEQVLAEINAVRKDKPQQQQQDTPPPSKLKTEGMYTDSSVFFENNLLQEVYTRNIGKNYAEFLTDLKNSVKLTEFELTWINALVNNKKVLEYKLAEPTSFIPYAAVNHRDKEMLVNPKYLRGEKTEANAQMTFGEILIHEGIHMATLDSVDGKTLRKSRFKPENEQPIQFEWRVDEASLTDVEKEYRKEIAEIGAIIDANRDSLEKYIEDNAPQLSPWRTVGNLLDKDPSEIPTYLLSRPVIAEWAQTITVNSKQTLWDKFVTAVMNSLGITQGNTSQTLYEKTLAATSLMLTEGSVSSETVVDDNTGNTITQVTPTDQKPEQKLDDLVSILRPVSVSKQLFASAKQKAQRLYNQFRGWNSEEGIQKILAEMEADPDKFIESFNEVIQTEYNQAKLAEYDKLVAEIAEIQEYINNREAAFSRSNAAPTTVPVLDDEGQPVLGVEFQPEDFSGISALDTEVSGLDTEFPQVSEAMEVRDKKERRVNQILSLSTVGKYQVAVQKLQNFKKSGVPIPDYVAKLEASNRSRSLRKKLVNLVEMMTGEKPFSSYNIQNYLTNDDSLPLNQQNLVVTQFKQKGKPSIYNSMESWSEMEVGSAKYEEAFGEDAELAGVPLDNFNELHTKITEAVDAIFYYVDGDLNYRHNDWTKYLTDENGQLLEHVKPAITAAAYNWIIGNAKKAMFNAPKDIAKIIAPEDKSYKPTKEQVELLKYAGVAKSAMIKTLGSDIFNALQLTTKKDSYVYSRSKMSTSLGSLALWSMVKAGLLTTKEIPSDAMSSDFATAQKAAKRLGLYTKRGQKQEDFEEKLDAKTKEELEAQKKLISSSENTFFRPASDVIPKGEEASTDLSPYLENIVEGSKEYNKLTEKLFNVASSKVFPTFTPSKNAPVTQQGSFMKLSKKMQDILIDHMSRKQVIKKNIHSIWTGLDVETQARMNGFMLEDEIAAEMVADRAGMLGKNRAIMREIEDYAEFVDNVMQGDLDKGFYLKHSIWKQLRIGIQGVIDPQRNKIQRSLIMQEGFENELSVNNPQHMALFSLAVAEGLDLDVDKKQPQTAIREVGQLFYPHMYKDLDAKTLAQGEALQAGVAEIIKRLDDPNAEMNQEVLLKAVKAGKMKTHTLDVLVNVAEYQRALRDGKTTFKANAFREIDGITNGVAIGTWQFAVGKDLADTMAKLNRMGFGFDSDFDYTYGDFINREGQLDTYQSLVPEWRKALFDNLQKFTNSSQKQEQIDGKKLAAIIKLIGNKEILDEVEWEAIDGLDISKAERDGTKYPLMFLVYGSSDEAVQDAIGKAYIAGVYKKMKAINEDHAAYLEKWKGVKQTSEDTAQRRQEFANIKNELTMLVESVEVVLGEQIATGHIKAIPEMRDAMMGEGTFPNLLEFEFSTKQVEDLTVEVGTLYGEPLTKVVDTNFKAMKNSRDFVNKSARFAFLAFEGIYNHEVEKAKEAKRTEGNWVDGISDLTAEEYDAIRDSLLDVMPIVDNYWSLESGDISNGTFLGKYEKKRIYSKQTKSDSGRLTPQHGQNPYYVGAKFRARGNPEIFSAAKRNDTLNMPWKKLTTKTSVSYAEGIVYADGGVAPTVLQIHGIDGASMLNEYSKFNVWGIHDAIATGILESMEGGRTMNEAFKEVIFKVDILQDNLRMLNRSLEAAKKYDTENNTKFAEQASDGLKGTLKSMIFNDRLLIGMNDKKDSFRVVDRMSGTEAVELFATLVKGEADKTTKIKKKLEKRLTTLDQYHVTGGELRLGKNPNTGKDVSMAEITEAVMDALQFLGDGLSSPAVINTALVEGKTTEQVKVEGAMQGIDVTKIHASTTVNELKDMFAAADINMSSETETVYAKILSVRPEGGYTDINDLVTRVRKASGGHRFKAKTFVVNNSNLFTNDSGYLGKDQDLLFSAAGFDTNAYNYDERLEVTNYNSEEVFDQLLKQGTIQETPAHTNYLRKLLTEKINKVLQPFMLNLAESDATETVGATSIADVYIVNQANPNDPNVMPASLAHGIRMSSVETYVHELVHNITRYAFQNKPMLRRLARRMYETALKQGMDYTFFMNPDMKEGMTGYAEEVEAAKARFEHMSPSNKDYLDEFMAFGMTNAHFRKKLSELNLKPTKEDMSKKTWLERISQLMSDILDFVFMRWNNVSKLDKGDEQLTKLMSVMAGIDGRKKAQIITSMETKFSGGIAKLNNVFSKFTDKTVGILSRGLRKTGVAGMKGLAITAEMAKNDQLDILVDTFREFGNAHGEFNKGFAGVVNSVIVEGKGRTERNGILHDIKRIFNARIDQVRKREMQAIKANLKNAFTRELSTTEQRTITWLVRTDLAALDTKFGWKKAKALVTNNVARKEMIDNLAKQIRTEFPTEANYYLQQIAQLGHFMIHESGTDKAGVIKNAHLIATLAGTSDHSPNIADLDKRVELIDTMTSVVALNKLGKRDLDMLTNLINDQQDGMRYVVNNHKAFKIISAENIDKHHIAKGYIEDINDQNISVRVATLEDKDELEAQGYTLGVKLKQDPTELLKKNDEDPADIPDMYIYVADDGGMSRYNAGMVNLLSTAARGTNLYSVRKNAQDNSPALRSIEDLLNIQGAKMRARDRMLKGFVQPIAGSYTHPVFDTNGEIVDFAYLMSANTKDTILNRDLSIFEVMPKMVSTANAKPKVAENNRLVVDALFEEWNTASAEEQQNFIAISSNSPNPKYREIWYMFPNDMQQYIQEKYGADALMISPENYDLAFGYRTYSLTEILRKDPEARNAFERFLNWSVLQWFGDTAAKRLRRVRRFENIIQELVKMGKDIWVIKSFVVTMYNTMSNLVLLRMRGVPVTRAIRDYAVAIRGANDFKRDTKEKLEIEGKLSYATNLTPSNRRRLQRRLDELNAELANNPVKFMVDRGALQTIVEDVDTGEDADTVVKGYLREKSKKYTDRVPKRVRDAARTVLLMQGSKPYAFLRDAAQMSDFGARFALMNHQVKTGKMDKEEALGHAMDIFIDYDLPTHKMIQYGNDMGFLFFTKYLIRIIKILYTTMRDFPAQVLGTLLLQNYFGDVTDIYDTGLNPLSRVGTVFDFVSAPMDIATINTVTNL